MTKSLGEKYILLAVSDFDPDNCDDFKLPNASLKKNKKRTITSVKKGEVFEILNKDLKWWIKVRKVSDDDNSYSDNYLPSSIFVPIRSNIDISQINIDDEKLHEIIPEITEKEEKYFPLVYEFYRNFTPFHQNPIPKSNICSRIFYSWISAYIFLGFQRYLVDGDLWMNGSEKCINKICNDFSQKITRKARKNKKVSIAKIFTKNCMKKIILACVCKFLQDIIKFLTPFLIRVFINFLSYDSINLWHGLGLCLAFFCQKMFDSLLLAKFYELTTLAGIDFRCLLSSLVYRKIFKVRTDLLGFYPQSYQINLIYIDAYRLREAPLSIILVGSSLFEIALCFIYLYFIMGLSFLAGVGVMVVILPLNLLLVKLSKSIEAAQMRLKDQRIKLVNTILNCIKLVKLYTWEALFEKIIGQIRSAELKKISQLILCQNIIGNFVTLAPIFIVICTFYAFITTYGFIDAQTAFESIAVFNILRYPVMFLPDCIRVIVTAKVSLRRIKTFLSLPETSIDSYDYSFEKADNAILYLSNCSFSFSENESPYLRDINLFINVPGLHIIIGENGAGKTKLLQSVLNENVIVEGKIKVRGRLAYVPQIPWVRNATLRNNIIDDNKFNEDLYKNIKTICELKRDIEILLGGDEIEIGEKGVNLSGGQKQRIGLARSIYSKSDIYLLDDPFSNLDKNVGHQIFENALSSTGYLSDCIRILITHDDYYLKYADCIHIIEKGTIIKSGTLEEILQSNVSIEKYLSPMKYETSDDSTSNDDNDSNEINVKKLNEQSKISITALIDKDVYLKGEVNKNIYWTYIKSFSVPIFFIFCFLLAGYMFLNAFGNIYIAKLTSKVIYRNNSSNFFIIYGFLAGSQCLLTFLSFIAQIWGSYRASREIHKILLNCLFKCPITFFESNPIGRLINAFSREMSTVDENMSKYFRGVIFLSLRCIFSLLGVAYFIPYVFIGILPIAIVYYFIQVYYIKSSRQIQRLESLSYAPIFSYLADTIQGLSIIKCTKKSKSFIENFDRLIDKNSVLTKANLYCSRWLGVRLDVIANLLLLISSIIMLIVCKTGTFIASGAIGYILFTTSSITQTMSYFILAKCDLENRIISIERISQFYNVPFEIDSNNIIKPNKNWPTKGAISFTNYSCRYRKHLPNVLSNLNFTINSNEKIGVVGRTGSGKSSLLLSLFRMIEKTKGKIEIDGINIDEISFYHLRSLLTIIPQDAFCFNDTLRKNIDPADQYKDDEIWSALELSQLRDYASSLPEKLNFLISDFGTNMSSGQKQLLCLTRALLKHSKILMLDEATSNVDLKTDQIIQEIIRTQFSDCTVITIAHRIETIMKILVLENGIIVDFDSPENLLKNSDSIFAKMASHSLKI